MLSAYTNNLCYSRHSALYCPGNHLTSIRYSVVSLSTYKQITEYYIEKPTNDCFPFPSIAHPAVERYAVPAPGSDVKKNTKGMIRKLANFESPAVPTSRTSEHLSSGNQQTHDMKVRDVCRLSKLSAQP
jgi:hypothetical protein